MKSKKIIRLIITALLIASFILTNCQSLFINAQEAESKEWKTAEELIEEKGFLNGIQMISTSSGSSGNDIGNGGIWKSKVDFRPEVWREFFANSKAMGFDICKIWNNYQMGGILFDDDWRVIGPSETYLENLETIFKMAEESDLYICITLMTHFETAFSQQNNQYNYDRLVRLVHNKTYRDLFINNWLKPVLELSAKYPNVIMADLYCEPEADGGIWRVTRGTNWENMRTFLSELQKAVDKYNPKLATYSSSSCAVKQIGELYGGLDIDFYGYDLYSDGTVTNPADLFLDKPLVFGEVGLTGSGISNNEDSVSDYYASYLNGCVNNGIKAAFYWSYDPAQVSTDSLIDDDGTGRLRQATLTIRNWVSDRQKTLNNTPNALDTPAIMYSTGNFLRWFGSRNATKITVERSQNKENWTSVLEFNPQTDNTYEFYPQMYQYTDTSMIDDNTYYYRVKAENGSEVVYSDISQPITKYREVCSEEENLIICGSFDNFDASVNSNPSKGWYVDAPSDVNSSKHYKVITDGVEGDTTYFGKSSLYMANFMYQDITLKPNTDYTFTFHYKYTNNLGYYHQSFGLLDTWPSDKKFDSYKYFNDGSIMANPVRPDTKKQRNGEWHRYTYRFNSGNLTKVRVIFDSYYGDSTDIANWYLDEVYLFES